MSSAATAATALGAALVTGAASGIGAACAVRLARDGRADRLFLLDIDRAGLEAVAAAVTAAGAVAVIAEVDVADPDAWARFDRDSLLPASGSEPPLGSVVLAAGIPGGGPIAGGDFADWRRVMSVNLDGVFLGLSTLLPRVRAGGSVVVVGSATGEKAVAGVGAYGASKAAAHHLVRIAALEAAGRRIRVNAIAPGGVRTAIWEKTPWFSSLVEGLGREAAFATLTQGTPLASIASAEEIAAHIAFLLGPDAGFVTGAVWRADGGWSIA